MTDRPENWWQEWLCEPSAPGNNEPPCFGQRRDGRPPFSCTHGFRRRYLGNAHALRYWPDEDRLVLVFKPSTIERHPDEGIAAERTMPDTKEELIAWCRMVVELTS